MPLQKKIVQYSRHSVNGPSITGNVQLTDIYLSGNRMARLRHYHTVTGHVL